MRDDGARQLHPGCAGLFRDDGAAASDISCIGCLMFYFPSFPPPLFRALTPLFCDAARHLCLDLELDLNCPLVHAGARDPAATRCPVASDTSPEITMLNKKKNALIFIFMYMYMSIRFSSHISG